MQIVRFRRAHDFSSVPPLVACKKTGLFMRNTLQTRRIFQELLSPKMAQFSCKINRLNTVSGGQKDRVSRKKKVSIRPKGESSPSAALDDIASPCIVKINSSNPDGI